MFSLKNVLPKEKELEEEKLIAKYKKTSKSYINHQLEKATKKKRNVLSSAGTFMWLGIISAFISLLCYLTEFIKISNINVAELNETTKNAVVLGAYKIGILQSSANTLMLIFFICIIITVACITISFKYDKEINFYEKVIDAKFEDNKFGK